MRFVQLNTYTTPEVKEVRNQEWIGYGEDNNYFQYLIDQYLGSPTNNAIITGISDLIFGKGLDATNSNRKPDEYAQMKVLLKDDCVKKLCSDLKLMGQCAYQVIYNADHSKIVQVEHFPVETLRSEKCNDDGEVEAYYYYYDWTEYRKGDELTRIPVFGTSSESIEICYIKPYRAGFKYYAPVDYQGALQYAELEGEIANYHLNNIMNGLAPSMLINFNNGVPDEETQQIIEGKIKDKFSGSSNAGRFILNFNDSSEQGGSIEPVQLSDAHQQYEFLSNECMRKLMVGHRVISPMLLGIKDDSGFGNNADEIETASTLMDNTVIRPFQELLLKSFEQVLAVNGISLQLYFKTLQPLEFADLENAITKEEVEEQTGQKLSTDLKEPCWDGYEQIGTKIKDGKEVPNCVPIEAVEQLRADLLESILNIEQEDLSDYEIIDERPANENDDLLNSSLNLASVVSSSPNRKSEQDTKLFKVRYVYAPDKASANSRDFCRKMVDAGKVYRKEDLDKQSGDNSELSAKGESTYNIWQYKGGANCKHFWMRRVYIRKNNKRISVKEAIRKINELDPSLRKEAKFPVNDKDVAKRPADMENNGYKNPR